MTIDSTFSPTEKHSEQKPNLFDIQKKICYFY